MESTDPYDIVSHFIAQGNVCEESLEISLSKLRKKHKLSNLNILTRNVQNQIMDRVFTLYTEIDTIVQIFSLLDVNYSVILKMREIFSYNSIYQYFKSTLDSVVVRKDTKNKVRKLFLLIRLLESPELLKKSLLPDLRTVTKCKILRKSSVNSISILECAIRGTAVDSANKSGTGRGLFDSEYVTSLLVKLCHLIFNNQTELNSRSEIRKVLKMIRTCISEVSTNKNILKGLFLSGLESLFKYKNTVIDQENELIAVLGKLRIIFYLISQKNFIKNLNKDDLIETLREILTNLTISCGKFQSIAEYGRIAEHINVSKWGILAAIFQNKKFYESPQNKNNETVNLNHKITRGDSLGEVFNVLPNLLTDLKECENWAPVLRQAKSIRCISGDISSDSIGEVLVKSLSYDGDGWDEWENGTVIDEDENISNYNGELQKKTADDASNYSKSSENAPNRIKSRENMKIEKNGNDEFYEKQISNSLNDNKNVRQHTNDNKHQHDRNCAQNFGLGQKFSSKSTKRSEFNQPDEPNALALILFLLKTKAKAETVQKCVELLCVGQSDQLVCALIEIFMKFFTLKCKKNEIKTKEMIVNCLGFLFSSIIDSSKSKSECFQVNEKFQNTSLFEDPRGNKKSKRIDFYENEGSAKNPNKFNSIPHNSSVNNSIRSENTKNFKKMSLRTKTKFKIKPNREIKQEMTKITTERLLDFMKKANSITKFVHSVFKSLSMIGTYEISHCVISLLLWADSQNEKMHKQSDIYANDLINRAVLNWFIGHFNSTTNSMLMHTVLSYLLIKNGNQIDLNRNCYKGVLIELIVRNNKNLENEILHKQGDNFPLHKQNNNLNNFPLHKQFNKDALIEVLFTCTDKQKKTLHREYSNEESIFTKWLEVFREKMARKISEESDQN